MPLEALITALGRLSPEQFDATSVVTAHLMELDLTAVDIRSLIEIYVPTSTCISHIESESALPWLIDLHVTRDWCLRLSIWSTKGRRGPIELPHTHYGKIVTMAITPLAYEEVLYFLSAGHFVEVGRRFFEGGQIHIIDPDFAHAVIPGEGLCATLAVRSRPLVEFTFEAAELSDKLARQIFNSHILTRTRLLSCFD